MTPLMMLLLCLVMVATSFLSGIFGMAGGMILIGVLLVLLPVQTAMVLHAVTQIASNGWRGLLWRKHVRWGAVGAYVFGCVLALAPGPVFRYVPSTPVALIFLGVTPFLVKLFPADYQPNPESRLQGTLYGTVCMTLMLLTGVAGPLIDSFFLGGKLDRREIVATKAMCQIISHALKLAYFGGIIEQAGTLDPVLAVLAIVSSMVGTTVAKRFLEMMSDRQFRLWANRHYRDHRRLLHHPRHVAADHFGNSRPMTRYTRGPFRPRDQHDQHAPSPPPSSGIRPDRHGGGGVDRHRRHGRRRHLLDPRRGGAGRRQRDVARLRDRRRGRAALDLFLCQARRDVPVRGRRGAFPGQELRRRRPRRRPQPVHVGGLHHLARALRHRLWQLRRDLHHHDAVAAAGEIAGARRRAAAHRGQRLRRALHGPLGNRHRRDQGRDPGGVRRRRPVVRQAGQPVAGAVAGDGGDPVRRRRAVHRLRGFRAGHQRRARHARPARRCCRARSTPA